MEHSQRVMNELQSAADAVERGGYDVGTFVILSALYTEIVLAGILKEEKRKMKDFNDLPSTNKDADDYINFDEKVAAVLKHACCLEQSIVAKINAGIVLKGCAPAPAPFEPETGSCCSR